MATVRARLLDEDDKPLANTKVEVVARSFDNKPLSLASGVTDEKGVVSFSIEAPGKFIPRLTLIAQRGAERDNLSELVTWAGDAGDFGTLVVTKAPVLRAAATSFHAVPFESRELARLAVPTVPLPTTPTRPIVKTSISDLVSSAGAQLASAQTTLAASGSGFRLANVSMSLKVVPESANALSFPSADDLPKYSGSLLSVVDLEFHPTETAAPLTPQTTIPSVIGYTESLARRKLAEVGLDVDVVRQAVPEADRERRAGRVLTQQPAAGAAIEAGGTVVLTIAETA